MRFQTPLLRLRKKNKKKQSILENDFKPTSVESIMIEKKNRFLSNQERILIIAFLLLPTQTQPPFAEIPWNLTHPKIPTQFVEKRNTSSKTTNYHSPILANAKSAVILHGITVPLYTVDQIKPMYIDTSHVRWSWLQQEGQLFAMITVLLTSEA